MVSRNIVIAIAVIVVIIVGVILYAYLYGPLAPRPGGVSKDRIVVGFTVALSGPLSAQGTEQLRAYQICADYINSQGGIYVAELGKRLPINLTYYDDSSDASKARSLYEKLVTEDRVDFLWPPFGTGIGLGIIPVINKYGIPIILATQTIATEERIRNVSSHIFLTYMTYEHVGAMYAAVIKKIISDHPELRRIAIIYAETDSTVGWATWTKRVLEEQRIGEVVYTASYPLTATDVRGILSRMWEAKPDIVLALTFGADSYVVIPQMKELRINPKVLIMTGPGASTRDFYTRFDNATREGIIYWTNMYPDMDPVLKSFWDAYVSKYGYAPIPDMHGLVYKSCLIFKAAIEKAGSLNYTKIEDVLRRESFTIPFGPLSNVRFINQAIDPPFLVWVQYQGGVAKPIFITVGRYPNITFINAPWLVPYEYPKPEWS
ncbi:MAG: amino acid ABC transporter substrate-binding protein [Sulfolobales archaeon]